MKKQPELFNVEFAFKLDGLLDHEVDELQKKIEVCIDESGYRNVDVDVMCESVGMLEFERRED